MARKQMVSREDMLAKTRQKMNARSQNRRDPDEFRCPLAKGQEVLEFYFKVLPSLVVGEVCKGGKCDVACPDDLWYYENGAHFINRKRVECPRIHDRDECPLCQMGFDMMRESTDEEYKKRISRSYLSRSYYAVNVYFIDSPKNPENLRGKVMWYNASKQVYDKWDACINSDSSGDKEEPLACGCFFHPYEGTYVFKLKASRKGDYNTYEESGFLPNTFGPLVRLDTGEPDDEAIERILDQRLILPKKFETRELSKIEEIIKKDMKKETGDGTEEFKDAAGAKKDGGSKKNEELNESTRPAPRRDQAAPASKPAQQKAPAKKDELDEQPRKAAAAKKDELDEQPQKKAPAKKDELDEQPQKKAPAKGEAEEPAEEPAEEQEGGDLGDEAVGVTADDEKELNDLLGTLDEEPE